jgi:hypothetical protein
MLLRLTDVELSSDQMMGDEGAYPCQILRFSDSLTYVCDKGNPESKGIKNYPFFYPIKIG